MRLFNLCMEWCVSHKAQFDSTNDRKSRREIAAWVRSCRRCHILEFEESF